MRVCVRSPKDQSSKGKSRRQNRVQDSKNIPPEEDNEKKENDPPKEDKKKEVNDSPKENTNENAPPHQDNARASQE